MKCVTMIFLIWSATLALLWTFNPAHCAGIQGDPPQHTCICSDPHIRNLMSMSGEYQCVVCVEDLNLIYPNFQQCTARVYEIQLHPFFIKASDKGLNIYPSFLCPSVITDPTSKQPPETCKCGCNQLYTRTRFLNEKATKRTPNTCLMDPCRTLILDRANLSNSRIDNTTSRCVKEGKMCASVREPLYNFDPNAADIGKPDERDAYATNRRPKEICTYCLTNQDCQNNGICPEDEVENRRCLCPSGYVDINGTCTKNPCMPTSAGIPCFGGEKAQSSQGICSRVTDTTYSCACLPAFYGDNCEFTKQCILGTTCVHAQDPSSCIEDPRVGGYNCGPCSRGWSGKNCDTENTCLTRNPCGCPLCCIPTTGAEPVFDRCDCTSLGKHGPRCEYRNKCNAAFCTSRKNGICVEDQKDEDPTCNCNDNFSGFKCEIENFCRTKYASTCVFGTCDSTLSTESNFYCNCDEDYGLALDGSSQSGWTCSDLTCNTYTCDHRPLDATTGQQVSKVVNGKCECTCNSPMYLKSGSANVKNPCVRDSCVGRCVNNGICVKGVDGSTSCDCPAIFRGDSCEMTNTCGIYPTICGHGTCVFTGHLQHTCNCDPGYTGDKCETINVCITNQNVASSCVNGKCEPDGNTDYICDCTLPGGPTPYVGRHCQVTNLCNVTQENCFVERNGAVRCYPCQNNGICTPILFDEDFTNAGVTQRIADFTCNCLNINYIGQFCEIRKAILDLSQFPTIAKAGESSTFKIIVKDPGDAPLEIIVTVGTKLKFSLALSNFVQLPSGDYTYEFNHGFASPGSVNVTIGVRNVKLLSDMFRRTITVASPDLCLPKVNLINCGHDVTSGDETLVPNYKRKSLFVITTAFYYTDCDGSNNAELEARLQFNWGLFQLTKELPVPSSANTWSLPAVTNDFDEHAKFVIFAPFKINAGRYWIEVNVTLRHDNGSQVGNLDFCYFKVENEAPFVQIRGGSERTIALGSVLTMDATGIDYAELVSTDFLEYTWSYSRPGSRRVSCNVFSSNCRAPTLVVDPNFHRLVTTSPYTFNLQVKSDYSKLTATTQQIIRVQDPALPVTLECIKNCGKWNHGDRVLVRCSCTGCPQNVGLTLTVFDGTTQTSFVLDKYGEHIVEIEMVDLRLTCTGKAGEVSGQSILRIPVNKSPNAKNSICKIVDANTTTGPPPNVIFLVDKFHIECLNFGTSRSGQPLVYLIYAKIRGLNHSRFLPNGILLFNDVFPDASDIDVPPGLQDFQFLVDIKIKVVDALGGFVWAEPTLTVAIMPPEPDKIVPIVRSHLLLNSDSSTLSVVLRRMRAGDEQRALQIMSGLMYSKIGFTSDNETVQQEWNSSRQDFLMAIGSALRQINLHSTLAIQHVAQAHYLLCTDFVDANMTIETLQHCKELQLSIANAFRMNVGAGDEVFPTEDVSLLARASKEAASRLLDETISRGKMVLQNTMTVAGDDPFNFENLALNEVDRDYFSDIYSEDNAIKLNASTFLEVNDLDLSSRPHNTEMLAAISQDVFEQIERLLDAASDREVKRFEFDDKSTVASIHGSVELIKANDVAMRKFTNAKVSFMISGDIKSILDDQRKVDVFVEMIEIDENPFFGDTSHPINTAVTTIILKDAANGEPIGMTAQTIIDVFIPRRAQNDSFQTLNSTVALVPGVEIEPQNNIYVHKVLVPPGSKLEVRISTNHTTLLFLVVALKDFIPSRDDFCMGNDPTFSQDINPSMMYKEHRPFALFNISGFEEAAPDEIDHDSGLFTYYIGIWAHAHDEGRFVEELEFGTNITYSVFFLQTSCLIRDENKNVWNEKSCEIGSQTTDEILHCRCGHLSIFAGSVFIPPNKLNLADDLPLLLGVDKNPIVISTVGAIFILYIILLCICYLLDSQDKTHHAGLTIMTKIGEDFEHSYYIVTVITGSRFFAGTSANVSIQLYGSNGRSEAYVIKDPTLPVLNRGGNDSFLISSKKELGNLEKIRIWHDNSGRCPGWYLRRIIIQNIKTNQQWYFFIENWLSLTNEDDPAIIRQINVAGPKEPLKWSRRFNDRLVDEFNNAHLWFSIFLRYPTSNFTRCQRLTCALAILTSYMLINIMFFGIPTNDYQSRIEFGVVSINALDILLSFWTTLLALPFGFILVRLFRRIRPRYIPTLIIWKNRAKYKIEYNETLLFVPDDNGISKEVIPVVISSPDRTEPRREFSIPETNIAKCEAWIAEVTRGENLNIPHHLPTPSKFIRGIDEDGNTVSHADKNETGRTGFNTFGRWAIIDSIRRVNPHSFFYTGDNDNRRVEELIDEEIQGYADRGNPPWENMQLEDLRRVNHELRMQREELPDISPVEAVDRIIDVDADGNEYARPRKKYHGIALELYEMSPVSKITCYFPWWFVYCAWAVCLVIIVACSFVTILYGLRYGRLRSLHWLSGFLVAWLQSLFLIQPFTILFIAFVFSIFIRKIHLIEEDRFQILFKEDGEDIGNPKPLKMSIFRPVQAYPPLSSHEIFRLRVKARRKNTLKKSLISIVFHIILMMFLFFIANQNHSSDQYAITDHMRKMLQINNLEFCPTCVNELALVVDETRFYFYLENVFLPAINPIERYDGKRLPPLSSIDPTIMLDESTLVVGVARLRQLRIKPNECKIPRNLKIIIAGAQSVNQTSKEKLEPFICTPNYAVGLGDNETYNQRWQTVNGRRTLKIANDVWKYRTANETGSLGRKGVLAYYDGAGYVAELGKDYRRSHTVLSYLRRNKWIDYRTRAVFLEFVVFNPNLNLFADVVITFERSPSTAFRATLQIIPLRLSNSNDDEDYTNWIVACYIFVAILLLILCFLFSRDLIYHWTHYRWNLFCKFWLWADFLIIIICLSSLGVALYVVVLFDEVNVRLETSLINEYVSFQEVALWNFIQTTMFALSICLCMIKFWKLLVLSFKRFYVMSLTLKLTSSFLLAFILLFVILTVAFAMFGNMVFGQTLEEFHSLGHAFIELINQLLSVKFYTELREANSILGPIYYFVFGFFVCCIGLNIFIALLNQGFLEAKEVAAQKRNWLTYWTYMKKAYHHFYPPPRRINPAQKLSIPPRRLIRMKEKTAEFLKGCLQDQNVLKMDQMRRCADHLLRNTEYCMLSKVEKWNRLRSKLNTARVPETRMDQMRIITKHFIKEKKHIYFTGEEFKKYAQFNASILKLRYAKIHELCQVVTVKLDNYLKLRAENNKKRADAQRLGTVVSSQQQLEPRVSQVQEAEDYESGRRRRMSYFEDSGD